MTRKSIRLDSELYRKPGAVFHVILTCNRKRQVFTNPKYAELIYSNILTNGIAARVNLLAFVIMPDHIHMLIGIQEIGIVELLDSWKSFTTNLLHKNGHSYKVWQRSFWDRGMRDERDVNNTIKYILDNPYRTNLISYDETYKYAWCYAES